ncbi:MAG: flagellar basal body-associated FliL family protein [Sulfurimicrobium sp.]|nr:flagellar basal body-associated FliL family protein [Sulfurimicrobium sp.]MDP1703696.1 flagellar basal body-associated FliL family protein [Sulfurimicrobium sp.]MDP3688687.1 flagellar basal body-associated FliL family protein [Sulfurimicrobium sp.]
MRYILASLLAALILFSASAQASGGGGGGASPYAKLETFTVNLQGLTQYLQLDISLKVADPKIAESIKGWSPVIRHELILVLSSQNGEELATLAGKKKLSGQIKAAINKVLKLDAKEGVTDVLFESFVIQ